VISFNFKLNTEVNVNVIYYLPFFYFFSLALQEDKLLWYLNAGPLTVALNALNWQFYVGGIIQFNCDARIKFLNHAVQIVGYDLSAEIPHYIIRNSWGLQFGNSGYMKIAIGNNVCGIANQVSRIIVE
jgi:cathepsin O